MAKKTRSFKPVSGDVPPRLADVASFMRPPPVGATMMYEILCLMAGRIATGTA